MRSFSVARTTVVPTQKSILDSGGCKQTSPSWSDSTPNSRQQDVQGAQITGSLCLRYGRHDESDQPEEYHSAWSNTERN